MNHTCTSNCVTVETAFPEKMHCASGEIHSRPLIPIPEYVAAASTVAAVVGSVSRTLFNLDGGDFAGARSHKNDDRKFGDD